MKRSLAAAAALGAAAASRLLLRNAGSTRFERGLELPGDDLVEGAGPATTMAVTIDAPPLAVWQWLAQLGCDRGGFYSYDRLDNGGRPSVEEIRPEWQTLEPGLRLASTPSGRAWFVVAAVEPERSLVLRFSLDLRTGRPYDPAEGRPRFFVDSTWAFVLQPTLARTRLVVRTRGAARPGLAMRLAGLLFLDPAHLVMQQRQLTRLRRLAEHEASDVVEAA